MLNKIALLNSATYSKAEIKLDTSSIQLLGGNNAGKTSLVSSLLFLFVIDRKKMKFEKNHSVKESTEYYFPQQNRSYIFFEGFHKDYGYFYMMLIRNSKNRIEYYLNKQKLDLDNFLQNGRLMSFDEVMQNPKCGIFERLKDNREIVSFVFQKKSSEMGFLHINKNINETQFQNIYNYIFNLSSLDGKSLKTGILILRDHLSTVASFDFKDGNGSIEDFKKLSIDVKELESVEKDYYDFKKIVSEKNATLESFKKAIEEIIHPISKILSDNSDFLGRCDGDIASLDKEISSIVLEQSELDKNLKATRDMRITLKANRDAKDEEIRTINSYQPKEIITQMLINTEAMIRKCDSDIEKAEKVNSDPASVKKELQYLHKKLEPYKKRLEKSKTILDEANQEVAFLNAMFSDSVKSLDAESLLKQGAIEDRSNVLVGGFLFDFSMLKEETIESREELQEEAFRIESRIKELLESQKNISSLDELKKERDKLNDERFKYEKMIKDYDNFPKLQEKIQELNEQISEYQIKEKSIHASLEECKSQIANLNNKKKLINEQKEEARIQKNELINMQEEIDIIANEHLLNIAATKNIVKSFESVKTEYNKIRTLNKKLTDELLQTERIATNIRNKIKFGEGSLLQDSHELLLWLEEQISILEEKRSNRDNILTNISNTFSGQASTILNALEDVKKYKNQFNKIISNYKISNLERVSIQIVLNENLVSNLEHIRDNSRDSLLSLTSDSDNRDILSRYINESKKITIEDLFDIGIEYQKEGRALGKAQSNGTEKMVRSIILLIIIKDMVQKGGKIPFMLDELGDLDKANTPELLRFCSEHGFLPIFVGTSPTSSVEKIYTIGEDGYKSYTDEGWASRWR